MLSRLKKLFYSPLRTMKKWISLAATRPFVRPFEPKRPPTKKVAIVVPLSFPADLSDDEKISLRQLRHYFGGYDKFMIAPEGVELDYPDFEIKPFPRRFFGSAAAHCRMLTMPSFYEAFSDYEFIFFHHLDSLAFSDQLPYWCGTDVDFIGPPWVKCSDSPLVTKPRVGNGGFTLIRVEKALRVLSNRHRTKSGAYWRDLFAWNATPAWIAALEKVRNVFPVSIIARKLLDEWDATENPAARRRQNDMFWSDHAVEFLPDFNVATLEQGLEFAFEVSPRTCLEMNGGKMPFGCHAWARYDREFWLPHLVPENGAAVKSPEKEPLVLEMSA